MNTIGTLRALDETRGAVRVEDVYDTGIEDLWEACTTPERLARWIAQVSGDLRVGADIQVVFTSTWTGAARIEVCDAPHHLLLTMQPGSEDECELEAWLTEEGLEDPTGRRGTRSAAGQPLSPRRRLAGAPRGPGGVAGHGRVGTPRRVVLLQPVAAWQQRWDDLSPTYRDLTLSDG